MESQNPMAAGKTEQAKTANSDCRPRRDLIILSLILGIIAQTLLVLARQSPVAPRLAWLVLLGPKIALVLYVLASSLFLFQLAKARESHALHQPGEKALEQETRLNPWDIALPSLAIVASLLAVVVRKGYSSHPLVWLLAGFALFGILATAWRLRGRQWEPQATELWPSRAPQAASGNRWDLAAIIAVLLIATALRANLLELVPSGVFFDEAQNGLDAATILEQNTHPIWSDSLSGRPTLHLHILAGVFRLIGVRVFSMKWVSITFGVLTVLALYLFARYLFGPQVAILSASFLALSRYHIHYSRIIFEAIMAPLLLLLALYFFWRAARRGRWQDYACSALFLGLGLYTYVSFRLLPLIFVFFVLQRLIFERGFLRRNLPGLLLFAAILCLLVMPLARFAWNNPQRFLTRFNEVSLWTEIKETGSWRPLLKNIVGYLTMFNHQGDRNRIQNLPGEPALSFFAGIFFVLGLAVSLYRWRDARYGGLVIWFLVALLPGILTHSIETPHSTRVIAAIPVVCLFAGLALWEFRQALAWQDPPIISRDKHGWSFASAAVVAMILGTTGLLDYRAYFVEQAANPNCYWGFEPAANCIGRLIEEWQKDYQIFVSPNYYYVFPEDAVVKFVAYNAKGYLPLDYIRDIPYPGEVSKGVAYILEPRFLPILPLLRRCYPQGLLQEYHTPFGALLFVTYQVEPKDILEVRGLEGRYYAGGDLSSEPIALQRDFASGLQWLSEDAPLEPPFAVRWQGSLYIPVYGSYIFEANAPDTTRLHLNGEAAGWGQEYILPKGWHDIVLEAQMQEPGEISVFWQGPGFLREVIPSHNLGVFTTSPHGLEATYYRNPEWAGAPASVQLDPFVFTNNFLLEGMFSISWRGQIYIPADGLYRFGTESDDASFLYLDDRLVVDNGGTHGARYQEGEIVLAQGWHDILIKYSQHGGGMDMALFWTPPGSQREKLPASSLRYPIGDWGKSVVAEFARPPSPTTAEPKQLLPFTLGPLAVKWGKEGVGRGEFRQPRGLAVDSQERVYVADSENGRVQVFDKDGRSLAIWVKGDKPFERPWDIVITQHDEVLVLDAGPCWIYRFDTQGKYLGKFAGPEARLYQPRGLSIDASGNIYVADTGGHRIVRFDPEGNLVATYGGEGSGPGQLLEPTDIAFSSTGEMFVVDNSNRRVQRWDAEGKCLGEWSIPIANAYNGPHLVILPDDSLLITVPELHEIWRYSPSGEILGKWGGPGQFRVPTDLALGGDKYLYVADTLQHQVQKFHLLRGS